MRYLSQTKAARLAGVSRGTIANRIDAGALSVTPDGIDPAELVRVFPDIDADRIERYIATGDVPDDAPEPASAPGVAAHLAGDASAIAAHAAWLQELVDEQRATIERKDRELREMQADALEREERREAVWLRQLDQLTALLPPPATAEPEPRGFLRRLFS